MKEQTSKRTTTNQNKNYSGNKNQQQPFFGATSDFFNPEVVQKKEAPFFEKVPRNSFFKSNNNSPPISTIQKQDIERDEIPIQKKENNTGLPNNLKTGMESLSGMSLDDVKVHRNSDKPSQLQAHAYAQGSDIELGQGQEKHLAHEAWHVVQQKQGRVKPTMQMKENVNVNDDAGLEKEADVMGAKALQMSNEGSPLQRKKSFNTTLQQKKSAGGVFQLYKEYPIVGQTNSKNIVHWKSNGDPLRVTEDGSAAIAQKGYLGGQKMYVDTSRLPGINAELKKVNAPVIFVQKGGGTVEGAVPRNLEGTKKTLAEVKPVEPADHSTVKEIPNDCGDAARTVTGAFADSKTLKTKYNDAACNSTNTTNSDPELMKYEVMVEHFGAQIKDSAKIIEDIKTQIESKDDLADKLEPFWDEMDLCSEKQEKLKNDLTLRLDDDKAKVKTYNDQKSTIAGNDPKKAEKIAAIDKSIQDIKDAFKLYKKTTNKEIAELKKKSQDILKEKIGGKTVFEIWTELDVSVKEYDRLNAAIMKPYNDQSAEDKEKFDEKVGINRHSNPNVGEAHTMSSGGNNYPGESTWNFHWGGVIFKSTTGSDNVTMENYAGSADSDWSLQIYGVPTKGNKREGQTFHEIHEGTHQHGDNPTTLTTEKK